MDEIALLSDLHQRQKRQGPGGEAETRLALSLSGLAGRTGLRIADIGCGTGASTLVLAKELDAHIVAVDFLPGFLKALVQRAGAEGLASRIETLRAGMGELPFQPGSLDAIWAEGAIYNIGFEKGVRAWRRFLKPGGILAVSELTWLTGERPAMLTQHWHNQYPEVATASAKFGVLEAQGYAPLGYFALPERCWTCNYYRPLQAQFEPFLARHAGSEAARAIVASEQAEIALYEEFSAYVSYGFYIAKKDQRPDAGT